MGRVLITSRTTSGARPSTAAPTPIVVVQSPISGDGTGRSPLRILDNALRPEALIKPGFPAVIATNPVDGTYTNIQLGPSLVINPATRTLGVNLTSGAVAISANPNVFTGDGTTTSPLDIVATGLQFAHMPIMPAKTLMGNMASGADHPTAITLGEGLTTDMRGTELSVSITGGLIFNSVGEIDLDEQYISDNIGIHTGSDITGDGTAANPLSLAPDTVKLIDLKAIPATSIIGNPANTQSTPTSIDIGYGLDVQGGSLVVDTADFNALFAPAVHTHDMTDIVSGRLDPNQLPLQVPLTNLANTFGGQGIKDGATMVWDGGMQTWKPSQLTGAPGPGAPSRTINGGTP